MSNHQQPTAETFNQRIDSLCVDFDAVADAYHILQAEIEDPSINALLSLVLDLASAILPTSEEIEAAAAAFKAAIPALEHAKPLLLVFTIRATTLQDRFRRFVEDIDDSEKFSLAEIIDPEHREYYVKFFGAAAINGGCVKESDARLDMVTDCLGHARSEDIGSEEWAESLY